jgi:hypothetical protein
VGFFWYLLVETKTVSSLCSTACYLQGSVASNSNTKSGVSSSQSQLQHKQQQEASRPIGWLKSTHADPFLANVPLIFLGLDTQHTRQYRAVRGARHSSCIRETAACKARAGSTATKLSCSVQGCPLNTNGCEHVPHAGAFVTVA